VPSGQHDFSRSGGIFRDDFHSGNLAAWDIFGHPQYIHAVPGELRLGHPEHELVNAFRSGEKLVLRDLTWSDARFTTRLRVAPGGKLAGVLFRTGSPAVGHHAQRAYFAAISADPGRIVLAYCDGKTSTELASAAVTLDATKPHNLEITARGEKFSLSVDGQPALTASDGRLTSGLLGLRIDDGSANFESVAVELLVKK
jgi:hypothetical protein